MNLKKRLVLANAATVVIPVIITVLTALAYVFIVGKLSNTDLSLESYQRLTQIKFELINSENSILKRAPETVEEESFQKGLKDRLAEINGELVVIKNDKILKASLHLSKIDLAKSLEAGSKKLGKEPVRIGNVTYTVQLIDLNFKDGSKGSVLLLAPVDHTTLDLTNLLVFTGIIFLASFALTNIFFSNLFSRSVIKPLTNLQMAAAEISRGNLDYQIAEEGDKEIQELCRDLELMRIKLKGSIHTQLRYEDNRRMLVSSISHDLKTPVTTIKGYVEGILDGVANTPEKMEKYLKTISLKAHLVDKMIDDLLLYAKLDLNQIPFNFERTEIADYLKECLLESESEFESSNIKITFQSELSKLNELNELYELYELNDVNGKRYVLLDKDRMKRVILNILDNSRKYINKEQGEINVLLRETNTSVIIEMRDNGSGITETDLPHIFDRFYRSDVSRSEIKGSGLGLAIAKQIVEGHNGRIWAVSHESEGTSIMISLGKS